MHYHLKNNLSLCVIAIFGFFILNPHTVSARTSSKDPINAPVAKTLTRRQQAIPGPPPDSAPKQGVGSASGTYCTDSPNALDNAVKASCEALIGIAQALGYQNAASHLQYYLDGSGVDFNIGVEALIQDLPNFAATAYSLVDKSAKIAYGHALVKPPGTQISFREGWKLYRTSKEESLDWYAAEGSFSYSVSGVATMKNNTSGTPGAAVLTYAVDIFDRYNWELGTSITFDLVTASSGPIGRLNEQDKRWAG